MTKKILNIMFLFLALFTISSCSDDNSDETPQKLPVKIYDKVTEEDFNRDLFYMNTLEFEVADPTVIYAEHGEGAGYFYAFGTSDQIGCHGFQCWRSKDLANWEYTGVALQPEPLDTWAVDNYWAPEIIYDEDEGLYFLFYNAYRMGVTTSTGNPVMSLSVAYSENVMGPYIIPDNIENQNGDLLTADKPVFDFFNHKDDIPYTVRGSAIDASPFIDPQTGERYMYWSWYEDEVDVNQEAQEIFGMRMIDWFTPDYSSMKQVTQINRTTVGGDEEISDGGTRGLNEGPFMYYKDGTYFLTYSVYPYYDPNYQVRLAVSDNPLEGFEKISVDDGGVVLSTHPMWQHVASAGHHQFIEVGGQLLVVYHTYLDRSTINGGRALAVDEVEFIPNSEGQLTMHANGPTYSLQPIPSVLSGYENVAPKATVTATNVMDGSSAKYLNDGIVKLKETDLAKETEFNEGKTEITFTFDAPQVLRALMVYNSYDIDKSFTEVSSVEIEYVSNAKGDTSVANIGKIPFDFDFHTYYYSSMYPGGSAVCEFEDLPVKSVKLRINYPAPFNVGEIKLLGATNKTLEYKSKFSNEYKYNNTVELNHYKNEGTVLGGTEFFDATYGWDLSTDDGSENAYTLTKGIGDSYVYFKDVVTTKFYAEGYISTFSTIPYRWDPFPKIGMIVRNRDIGMFFYIDAQNYYTLNQVGITQTQFGDPFVWDWAETEKLKQMNLNYSNTEFTLEKNFVKMAILRDGADFYLYINDQLIFKEQGTLRDLEDDTLASVGFLGFNSPLVIRNYSITTDSVEVDSILTKLSQ